ncbi:transcription repressor OFP8-like [Malania oleifera]|uniref:transcription repressor OFP8-like n=1 Tax=Malania oleifera TaxID=397392 RepID=UPI0025ADD486|nr:transcription repressor OFP8-like [Malania oleifera]
MSTGGRKFRLSNVSVSLGCRCRRSKLSDIFQPKPKSKNPSLQNPHLYRSSSSSWYKSSLSTDDEDDTTPADGDGGGGGAARSLKSDSWSQCSDAEPYGKAGSRAVKGFGRVGGESLAVEKESDDPYLDFRQSMLQMILEKEIYSKEDLRELLNCFLQLNSPYYHGIIVRAFTEIWNGVFSARSSSPTPRPKQNSLRRSREF